ncbi:MAG: hypothetical protein WCJ25_03075 [Candidatus Moraniibacteriota bacterium]
MEDQTGEAIRKATPEKLVAVTLNGGGVIKDGSIPVEWWISDSVIKENPEYILLVEQDADEINAYRDYYQGRRYLYEISKSVCYLQLFSAGRHRFTAIVFKNYETAKQYMRTDKNGLYDSSISWPTSDTEMPVSDSLGWTTVEFEVLEEAFAKIPETRFRKIGWYWVNLWWEKGPKDECEYKKWVWPCVILKPLVWLVMETAVCLAGIVHALYALLASLVTLFVGFRPRPILHEMKDRFTRERQGWGVTRYADYLCDNHSTYKLWSYKDGVAKYVFTTPAEITGVLAVFKLSYLLIVKYSLTVFVIWLFVLAVIIFAIEFLVEWILDNREEWKEKKSLLHKEWMEQNLDISKQTDTVNLSTAPLPLGIYGKLKQRSYRGFWALKSQVCKPYPKKK